MTEVIFLIENSGQKLWTLSPLMCVHARVVIFKHRSCGDLLWQYGGTTLYSQTCHSASKHNTVPNTASVKPVHALRKINYFKWKQSCNSTKHVAI